MEQGQCVSDVVHYYIIKVFTKHGNGELVELIEWRELRWELRLKYDWYFKYRAALAQVKYPKYYIDTIWGHENAKGIQLEQIIENKKRAKKAKLTSLKNKLRIAKEEWNSLFPIEEDQLYKLAVDKISRMENEFLNFN
jgi:hypothetical protein